MRLTNPNHSQIKTTITTCFTMGAIATLSLVFAGCDQYTRMSSAYSRALSHPAPHMLAHTASGEEDVSNKSSVDTDYNTETYDHIIENPYFDPTIEPRSAFAIDVDTASYSLVRRAINNGYLPVPGAVRIEEMVNYFQYDYQLPTDRDTPFAANIEVSDCPWNSGHKLAAIGIKAWDANHDTRPPANLVFVIDVSGSMDQPDKLPLLKNAMLMLAREVRSDDRIGIVTYANDATIQLKSTIGENRNSIIQAIDNLRPGGGTNGEGGLQLAYKMASDNYIKGGVNRILIATDGDFNIGVTSQSELIDMVENKAKSGVYLTVLGFGTGNYKDSTLEKIADHGNGNYAYIDNIHEARRTLIDRMGSTLITVAKDVKIQVEFNPALVAEYRLLGYENRLMNVTDFYDEQKDAGEIGAGHTVTAMYEIVPKGANRVNPNIDDLKYQTPLKPKTNATQYASELFTVRIRYKDPDGNAADEIVVVAKDTTHTLDNCSSDYRLAAAVTEFSLLLRGSEYQGNATMSNVLELALSVDNRNDDGSLSEFLQLVRTADALQPVAVGDVGTQSDN